MASSESKQLRVATEPDFCNMAISNSRTPAYAPVGGVLSFGGLHCSDPDFKAAFDLMRNEAVRNRYFTHAPKIGARPGTAAFGHYLRACGAAAYTDPMWRWFDAMFGKQSTSSLSYTVTTWDSTTQVTLASVASLAIGQGFATVAGGTSFVAFITNIAGLVVTFAPALPQWVIDAEPATIKGGRTYATGEDYAANKTVSMDELTNAARFVLMGCVGSKFDLPLETGKMAVARIEMAGAYAFPSEAVTAVGSTDEPVGPWLKFLNGVCAIDGTEVAVRSCNWSVDFSPQLVKNPNNAAGGNKWTMSNQQLKCSVELSEYDLTKLTALEAGTHFSLITTMGTGEAGSAFSVFAPAMHLAAVPEKGAAENTITGPLELEVGLGNADTGSYDGGSESSLVDTLFRVFAERGA